MFSLNAFSQSVTENAEIELEEIYSIVVEMPIFPGGEIQLRKFIANNVEYPKPAIKNNIQGKVYVKFKIDKRGEVGSVSVVRGIHETLDKASIRVVRKTPNFSPGKKAGNPVSVWFTVPINFILD